MLSIDYESLKKRCLAPIESYYTEGEVTKTPDGIYIFRDRESMALAIAHLDTVVDSDHFDLDQVDGRTRIRNAQLDDRLGAYIILDLLPTLGIQFDVLLTEGEEVGRSTAKYFMPPRQYNWMFSFDRGGIDVVMYQYDDESMRQILQNTGFTVGKGTGSDIKYLEHLGCKGFNFGCAYYDRHRVEAYAIAEETLVMVGRFSEFYSKYGMTAFRH